MALLHLLLTPAHFTVESGDSIIWPIYIPTVLLTAPLQMHSTLRTVLGPGAHTRLPAPSLPDFASTWSCVPKIC